MIINNRFKKRMKRKEKIKNWLFSRKRKKVVKALRKRSLKQLSYKITIQAEEFNMTIEDLEFILFDLQKKGDIKLLKKDNYYNVEILKAEVKAPVWEELEAKQAIKDEESKEVKQTQATQPTQDKQQEKAQNTAVNKMLAEAQEILNF